MKRTVLGVSVALLVATTLGVWDASFPAEARTQPASCAPLQMSDIEDYVEVKAPVAVVRRRVGECGLGFTFDKTAEDRLRSLGAPADLIAMLAGVGRSRLEVLSTPPGAAVSIDGQRRGTTPLVVNDLPPGAHRVVLTLDGYLENASDVTTRAGDTEQIERTLTRTPTQGAPPATAPPATSGGGGSKLPWILGGAAAVGGGVAIAAASGGGGNGTTNSTTTVTPSCTVSVSRTSFSFGFAGGSQSADVIANLPNCTWSFSGAPSWLTIAPSTGTSSSAVSFTADANTVENGSTQNRTASFTVASTSLTATQEGLTCTNTVATRDNLSSVGNGGTVNAPQNDRYFTIQTAGECRWTARTSASWMYFRENSSTSISGTGPRVGEGGDPTLRVVFQQNTGPRRSGTITVASTTFNVTQCASTEQSC